MRSAVPVALVFLAALAACREVLEERYADHEAARAAGAVARGWIPAWVPPSARDIREVHDLDTNAQTLSFSLPVSDVAAMVAGLSAAQPTEATAAKRLLKAAGWPADPGVAVYALCWNGRPGALAVDSRTGAVFHQSPTGWRADPCARERPR